MILVVFLTLSTQAIHARFGVCNISADCGPGFYCSERFCRKCMNCDLFFRKGTSCAPNFSECGECLEGYQEILITDFSTVDKPCEPIRTVKHSEKCFFDETCPPGKYCHQTTCVKCFDCGLFNRLSPPEGCAKEPNECKSCMNGFYEVPVTTITNIKPCEKASFISSEITDPPKVLYITLTMYISLILVLFLVIPVLFLFFKRRKGVSKPIIEFQPPLPSAPPLCSMYVPRSVKELEGGESPAVWLVKEEKQQANTAKVFRLPQASYYNSDAGEVEELNNSSSESDDEDTRPSSWTPHPRAQQEDSVPMVCSFKGYFTNGLTEVSSSASLTNSLVRPATSHCETNIELVHPSHEGSDTTDFTDSNNEENPVTLPEENDSDRKEQSE